jgi:hypothetical protein
MNRSVIGFRFCHTTDMHIFLGVSAYTGLVLIYVLMVHDMWTQNGHECKRCFFPCFRSACDHDFVQNGLMIVGLCFVFTSTSSFLFHLRFSFSFSLVAKLCIVSRKFGLVYLCTRPPSFLPSLSRRNLGRDVYWWTTSILSSAKQWDTAIP